MSTLGAFFDVACYRNRAIILGCDSAALLNQFAIRRIGIRATGNIIHAQLRAANHQRICNVVFRITHKHHSETTNIAEILSNGQRISDELCWVGFGGQTIPNRNACVFSQRFNNFLAIAAVFDTIKHAAKNASGIFDRFLVAICEPAGSRYVTPMPRS